MNTPACRSAFLIIYLGKLPGYFDFWAKTCAPNHDTCHWFVYNDHIRERTEYNKAVTIVPYTFEALCSDMASKAGIHIPDRNTRIVCDCRVMLYLLRKAEDHLDQYDFIGYSDIDVVYGRINDFLPENPTDYALISAHEHRPCGPFTLFNRTYLGQILSDPRIKTYLEYNFGNQVYDSAAYTEAESAFKPVSGNRQKDQIRDQTDFKHLDESDELVEIAARFAPVFCSPDSLQPTMTKGFNHRKAIAFWNRGRLTIVDNLGHKREGAFFHFSRFKNRKRFKVDPDVLSADHIGIYKYGFIAYKSPWTFIKLFLTMLY